MDLAPDHRGHRHPDRGLLSPRSCLAADGPAGLEPPAPGPQGVRAGRGRHRRVGQDPLDHGKKNARRRGAWIVFEDESGISLTPPVRRTWAPIGETPVIRTPFNWKRMSMAAALIYAPDGSEAVSYTH